MIEIRNLKKTYNVKGNITKALDDVTIKFPETGMVFLLGKSGSGKSTLLNICGGLDEADSGEVIIMGKSSSTFSKSDFDSYRNTYVGFIFQEYNILSEFSIEDNLSLALELQGKKKDKEKVDYLLKQVDLDGFAKRKPNTLSGGQKQRIAIARALIKDPKIIMADEPTGALDSKTGKQVFDTLKKLSKDHLVIVVSHDREFSEIYGDRIIELKDGKILSDETKEKIDAKVINENIEIVGNNTLSIKNSKNLRNKDIKEIINFINENEGQIIISKDNEDINSFKKANRIDESNKTEKFKITNHKEIKMKKHNFFDKELIKSKMPMSKAAKMGVFSLRIKPFRLILTILLTVTSFILFGVASSLMNFDRASVVNNSFNASEYSEVAMNKKYNILFNYYHDNNLYSEYSSSRETYFSKEEIDALNEKYGNDVLGIYYTADLDLKINNYTSSNTTPKTLTSNKIRGFAYANENSKYRKLLYGTYPTLTYDIAISTYMAENILANDIIDAFSNSLIEANTKDDLINKKININGFDEAFTIKGIFEGTPLPAKLKNYNDKTTTDGWPTDTLYDFSNYLNDSNVLIFLTSDKFYDAFKESHNYIPQLYSGENEFNRYFVTSKNYELASSTKDIFYSNYNSISKASLPIYYINDAKEDSIIVSIDDLFKLYNFDSVEFDNSYFNEEAINKFNEYFIKYYTLYRSENLKIANVNHTEAELNEFNNKYLDYYNLETELNILSKNYELNEARINEIISSDIYQSFMNDENKENYYNYINKLGNLPFNSNYYIYLELSNYYGNPFDFNTFSLIKIIKSSDNYKFISKDEIDFNNSILNTFIKNTGFNYNVNLRINNDSDTSTITLNRTIGGYYIMPESNTFYVTGIYVNDKDITLFEKSYYQTEKTKYELENSSIYYKEVFVPTNTINNVFTEINVTNDNDAFYDTFNTLYTKINTIVEMVNVLKKVFFYTGIVLAIFAAILLFNFITVSISSKSHEIGVLRAVGARGNDVFKIFFAESLSIALIAFVIALIGAIAIVEYLNQYIALKLFLSLRLLTFGPMSASLMLGIAITVATLATFIPVYIISRKKPVDSLKGI